MSQREFAVVAPDLRLILLLPAIGVIGAVVAVAIAGRTKPVLWGAIPVVAVAVGVAAWSALRNRIAIEDGTLRISAGLHRHRIAVDALDLAAARIVDLRQQPTLRPWLKTFGTSMPGYQAGHFRLRDRSRAFLLVTDRTKTLVLPERTGRTLLLTPECPQALLEALRAVAERGTRR
jgi:uncharacterized membrane protein